MLRDQVQSVVKAQRRLAALTEDEKNSLLASISKVLQREKQQIFDAQQEDISRSEQEGLAVPLLKRLVLDQEKLDGLCRGIDDVIQLKDPTGKIISARELDTGLELYQETCPIGVIGMVFESRPDALVQIATLCLKSGNGIVLKGGREAQNTNRVLFSCIQQATQESEVQGLSSDWICLVETRDEVGEMLNMDDLIDLLIPRGSNEFVRYIMDNTRIPVLGHADGICHIYIDEHADITSSIPVCVDAKCQYPAACNAVETILVHRSIAGKVLPPLAQELSQQGVTLRGDESVQGITACEPAQEEDWSTEYLDLVISVRVVDSLEQAVDHIQHYGSGHTDAILTEDKEAAARFMNMVDSAGVFWNCSTRFSDGFRYGLGAEVGISTQKIHARGPVGMEGLVTYTWKLYGSGQVTASYSGSASKQFTHREIDIS